MKKIIIIFFLKLKIKEKENPDLRRLRRYLVQKALVKTPLVVKGLVLSSLPTNLSLSAPVIWCDSCQLTCLFPTW